MKFRELIVLLPCHSLEDFPLHHEGEEAEGLLANWTALWHPVLIATAEAAPTWCRVDNPPDQLQGCLILVPSVSMEQLPTGFTQRAKEEQACLIQGSASREGILSRAFEAFDDEPSVDEELARDFLALGYCYLQIQLLTRQMRYASNLDESHFKKQLIEGAKAAVSGALDVARDKITACFDLLAEERDHYYAVDAYLIDMTMVAEQTLGAELLNELRCSTPINLLMPARLVTLLSQESAEMLDALRQAVADGTLGVMGGENVERLLPLLSCESLLADLQQGLEIWESHVGKRVEVFGRRRFGLTPMLPQILEKVGFSAALHATLEDGRFPLGSQVKTRWEGVAGATIDALARAPLDANKPETFLSLARKLGETMDADHVATVLLAHWPRRATVWYDDLRRCTKYGTALGKFTTIEAYFRDTYMPVHADRFEAHQYRSPYLKQAVIHGETDPLSTIQRYWQRQTSLLACQSISTLAALISSERGDSCIELGQRDVDAESERADAAGIDAKLNAQLSQAWYSFVERLPRSEERVEGGYLIVNPFSFVRRVAIEADELSSLPAIEKPVYAADESEGRKQVVVDVPPMGYAWVTPSRGKAKRKPSPPLAEDLRERDEVVILRNEFLEAAINPTTGVLQSLKDYGSRRNRLSQQLALRNRGRAGQAWRDADETADYSVMAADDVRVTVATTALGEVVVRGRLLNRRGDPQATYRETFRIWRGMRVLSLEIELSPEIEPAADPWNAYYACRFAWSDEAAELSRAVNQVRQSASNKRLEAPLYIEIDTVEQRTSILTCGLPYHQRVGERMLDCLLHVRGERQRVTRLGIGVDLPQPYNEALAMLGPPTHRFMTTAPPRPAPSSWLFHIDARNVAATHWEPLLENDRVVGFRARLLETAGRESRAKLSAFRSLREARVLDFRGEIVSECRVVDGRVHLELTAGEWLQLDARFA